MVTSKFVQILDLRKDNEYWVGDVIPCQLSATGYISSNWDNKVTVCALAIEKLSLSVAASAPNGRHVLLFQTDWLNNNRIVRFRKLWNALLQEGNVIPKGVLSEELHLEHNGKVKYFGFIGMETIDFAKVATIMMNKGRCALIYVYNNNDILPILTAFGTAEIADLRLARLSENPCLTNFLCKGCIGYYRQYAWVDERYSGLAYIANIENCITSEYINLLQS